jgi:hypothetical protein
MSLLLSLYGLHFLTISKLSNEFKFPIASLHHAGETYLVPELLKKAWVSAQHLFSLPHTKFSTQGGVPTIALFASNAR